MLLTSTASEGRARKVRAARKRLGEFSRREDGALIVFTLYILLCMLMAVGMAIDTVRAEFQRIRVQNTIDGAVLAAADLEQVLDPKEVIYDHLGRIGLSRDDIHVSTYQAVNDKIVSSWTSTGVKTMFMDMVGIDSLPAAASGTAEESVTDLEIALVLDNSGSMGQNSDYRLKLLKPAAKQFVETVLDADTAEKRISISIVPFSTQVTVGSELLSYYTGVTGEHSYSHCVTFKSADFETVSMPTTTSLDRTAHFDPRTTRSTVRESERVCSTLASRDITPWSNNSTSLKAKIDAMDTQSQGGAYTSIEIGAKWGAALLDPSARTALSGMIESGSVTSEFSGQPFDYTRRATQKFLVIMSDGANTNQYDVKSPFRKGDSTLYHKVGTSKTYRDNYVFYDENRAGTEKFYRFKEGYWFSTPADDPDDVERLTWPEVWKQSSVKWYTENLASVALGGNASTYYNQIVMSVSSSAKNTRTSKICAAAKAKGVVVYTIGMDTYGQGDATLSDCATSPAHFYDVQSVDIANAFESVARTITQLRLTN
ncbi:pilus assembly protein TadG-related protein [Tropicimonas marinistellae]|uniref:pilus assembly protein TadG-related protein n=1 Tax=Tropicimonas marinistellae TaxID=1739787 RepID=UPI000837588D|nr:pilus assembly protein TadG-related protein [Tropicimonas marinistellae]